MATKIWFPEAADRVQMLDGSVGYIHPDWSASLGMDEDSWHVVVSFDGGYRLRHNVLVQFTEIEGHWEEQEKGT